MFDTRFFEEISDEELVGQHGPFSLITDFFGVLAYSADPSLVLDKYFKLLKQDGRIFLIIGHDNPDNFFGYSIYKIRWCHPKRSTGTLHANKVHALKGEILSFTEWLERLPGIVITKHKMFDDKSQDLINFESWQIECTDRSALKIPLLKQIALDRYSPLPYERIFQEMTAEVVKIKTS